MFHPIPPKPDSKTLEETTLKFWKDRDIFHKSVALRQAGPRYVFYEEPSTAHAKPGLAQALARAVHDVFPRYQAMTGRHVLRRGGWDTHGLPVELNVEKKLGLSDKKQIEAYGVAAFNAKCRQAAFDYIHEWEQLTDRIGFWFDLKEAYVTYTNDYIESVWWILRQFWDRDLLHQGFEVAAYCPRCGTPLSDREVTLGAEVEGAGQSVLVRFPLVDEADTSLLVWTTAPWTLPANVAVAVHPDATYAKLKHAIGEDGDTEHLIVARDLVDKVMGEEAFEVVETFTGSGLRGKRYHPLFTFLPPDRLAYYVVPGEFVTLADGTGLAHLAPAFGAQDLQLAENYDLPVLMTLDAEGRFVEEVTPWRDKFCTEVDPLIIHDLADRGLLFRSSAHPHRLLACGHCQTPIIHYAHNTWYLNTTRFKDRLTALNQTVRWHPEPVHDKSLSSLPANDRDWVVGRERYWGTPLPVWACDVCGHQLCVASVQELSSLTRQDQSQLNLHRPDVDEVTFACPKCKDGHMHRVPELIDAWFDSGAMAAAQWHYPFENREKFEEHFPAAGACETAAPAHGWTSALQTISALLFDRAACEHIIASEDVTGLRPVVDGAGGQLPPWPGKSSPLWEMLDAHGADALRWTLYTAAPQGLEGRLTQDLVGETARALTVPLWNTAAAFVACANRDTWRPSRSRAPVETIIDRWILSELHRLVRDVTAAYDNYELTGATRPIQQFVDDLACWYLPRSRRRLWESSALADKRAAYSTLYECLTTLARLLAPAMPFLAEALYQNLAPNADPTQPESVHLSDWPKYDPARIDEPLEAEMRLAMKLASLGHSARRQASRKARQPLAEAAFAVRNAEELHALSTCADLIADDLNVKEVRALGTPGEAATYALNPRPKALDEKHGPHSAQIRAALLKLDAEPAAQALLSGQPVTVVVDGQNVDVGPDEVEVRLTAREGFAVTSEGGYLAALRTALTPELVKEGMARELIQRVQDLRETAGVGLADRIVTYYSATPLLAKAIAALADDIKTETLSTELIAGAPPQGAASAEEAFEGEKVKLGIIKQ